MCYLIFVEGNGLKLLSVFYFISEFGKITHKKHTYKNIFTLLLNKVC